MIGFFVNQLVLRCRLAGLQQVSELVAEARRVVLDGSEHQELPFDAIVAELRPERSVHEMPLFHAKLILQNIATPHFELPGLTVSELERGPHGVEVDLLVNASSGPDGLELLLDYRADRYSEATMNELLALTSKALELFGRVDVEALATLSELLNEEQRSLNASAAASTRALQDQGRSTLGQARRKPVPLAGQHSDEVTGQ
jgi:non-ribosomal peptide synthetase component F